MNQGGDMSRIIAADDDFALRHLYTTMLEQLGHEAVICADGREAVIAFQQKPADLLILDVNMPVMDGLATSQEIRRLPEGVRVPIIIVSSNDTEEDIAAGFNAGANDYMLKPVRESILIAKLKNFLKTASLHRHEFDLVKNHVAFLDRYSIEKVLGYGSHSVVFLAEDLTDKKKTAVKLLNQNVSNGPILQAMIEKVSRLQTISSPHLLKIIDYGQCNDQIYLILEYASEGDLKKRLTISHLSEAEAVKLARDILAALRQLELAGLCHLDLKPENILLSQADGYKLADFGLVTARETATMPLHGELWSTISYAAPESFTEAAAGNIRSDIYSLGITLYEAVTGDNPFLSEKPSVTMFRQLNLTPSPLAGLSSRFSFEFSDLISAMLCKRAENRPSLEELESSFAYLEECYSTSEKPEQLGFAEEEAEPKNIPMAPLPRHQRLKAKSFSSGSRPSFLDQLGEKAFSALGHGRGGKKESHNWLPTTLLAILCVVLFNFFGQMAFSAFSSDPATAKANLPVITVRCFSCSQTAIVSSSDPNQVKCSKCKLKVGYAMKCTKCRQEFPWLPPSGSSNTDPAQMDAMVAKSRQCPSCHSSATTYLAPPTTATKQGGK